jgi:hypothetical protein
MALASPSAQHVNDGTVLVSGGDLTITQSGTSPSFTSSGTITVPTGRTLTVAGGTFTHATSGLLEGAGTISVGSTTFAAQGTIAPGPGTGVLGLGGNYAPAATAELEIELGGTTAGTQYDRLAVTGSTTLTGTLTVTLTGGFAPTQGNQFLVISSPSTSGEFATLDLPTLGPGLAWSVAPTASGLLLEVIVP